MADVIDAVKRLERAGSEHSRATEKLCEAAAKLAEHVNVIWPREAEAYQSRGVQISQGTITVDYWTTDGDVFTERLHPHGVNSRGAAMRLAELVADGLLTELADWIEQQVEDAEAAATTLETATQ